MVAGCFLVIRVAEPFVTPELPVHYQKLVVVWFPLALVIGCLLAAARLIEGRPWMATFLLAVPIALCGAILIVAFDQPNIDVLRMHDAAADALIRGQNPYGQEVAVPATSPYAAPGTLITGYSYPPLTALAYSLGEWTLGDPRWTSLILLFATAAVIAISPRVVAQGRLAAVLLVALPGVPIVVFLGFTEPLVLFLLSASLILWERRPMVAAMLGGLAIASKQYMVLTMPLLLLAAFRRDPKGAGLMVTAGLASTLPFVLVDPQGFIASTISTLASLSIRPDGSSIQSLLLNGGFQPRIPLVITIGVPLLVSGFLAVRSRSRRDLATSVCMVLTIFFLVGSQGFVNYWFLVAGVAVLAYALPDREEPRAVAQTAVEPGLRHQASA
jgi:uncharacterized membrane protein